MCGILAILGNQDILSQATLSKLLGLIDQRGPDYNSPLHETNRKCGLLRLKASVLHLRGASCKQQPLFAQNGNILLYNGQIYKYSDYLISGEDSDTAYLFSKLNGLKTKEAICLEFSKIDGPFAFIYWCDNTSTLYFGRDIFGRRSLCQLSGSNRLPYIISSVGIQEEPLPEGLTWTEVDCSGIHCLDFSSGRVEMNKFTWDIDRIYRPTQACLKPTSSCHHIPVSLIKPLNNHVSLSDDLTSAMIGASLNFKNVLFKAIEKRVMFNQGTCLDCRKAKKPYEQCQHPMISLGFSGGVDSTILALFLDMVVDKQQTIDLINVSFKENSPDRIAAGDAFREICALRPERNWRLVLSDVPISSLKSERHNVIRHLILPCNTVIDDSLGCALWFVSRSQGRALDSCIKRSLDDPEFEEILGEFLNFKDSPPKENHSNGPVNYHYKSPAPNLFLGNGIDEALGGYVAHKRGFKEDGNRGVLREISFQMRRISSRNLGRDDRTCSYHGRDIKTPFLDFDLVSYLNELPIGTKVDLRPGSELGDKQILRYVGTSLGLKRASTRVKRALQFGTRIANLEDSNEKGSDICSRLV